MTLRNVLPGAPALGVRWATLFSSARDPPSYWDCRCLWRQGVAAPFSVRVLSAGSCCSRGFLGAEDAAARKEHDRDRRIEDEERRRIEACREGNRVHRNERGREFR